MTDQTPAGETLAGGFYCAVLETIVMRAHMQAIEGG